MTGGNASHASRNKAGVGCMLLLQAAVRFATRLYYSASNFDTLLDNLSLAAIMIASLALDDWRNIATIAGTITALVVYITNSFQQHRQREIENAMRFLTIHQRLIRTPFIEKNLRAMEMGTFCRDSWDEEMESAFTTFLGDLEHFALLLRSGAVSQELSIYMFGWFAQKIQPILTAQERANIYWELAVQCLDELKDAADDFYKKTKAERDRYHRKRHFCH